MDSKSEIPGNRPPTLFEEVSAWMREFPAEFGQAWRLLPNKGFFLALLAVWILLFQFLGNATFGYIDSSSLLAWMENAYDHSDGQDSHGLFIPFVVLALFWWKPKRSQLLALPNRIWW